MQTVDSTYKRIFRDPHHITEVRTVAGGVTYGIDKIYSARRERGLFAGSYPSIGNCVSATLELTIIPESRVDRLAPIALSTRLVTFDGAESTAWRPAGTFYADTRSEAQGGEEKTFTAFDALMKADIPYLANAQVASWPAADTAVAADIAALMGITVDSRTILAGYDVPLPEQDWTAREVLGWIAAANCGNWIVTDDNKLYLVPFCGVTSLLGTDSSHALLLGDSFIVLSTGIKYEDTRALLGESESAAIGFGSDFVVMNGRGNDQTVMGGDFTDIRQNASSCQNLGLLPPFSGVRLYWDKENSYEDQEVTENNETTTERVEIVNAYFSGDETGRVLEALCPWATQAMADAILANIAGYCWQGAEVEGAEIPTAAELGDTIICDGVVFSMARESVNFNGAYAPTISAPADEEVDYEYHYESETDRKLNRKVSLNENYYGFRVTRENGIEVDNVVDGVSTTRLILNSNEQKFFDADGNLALYFDPVAGKYRFMGDVIVAPGYHVRSSAFAIFPIDATDEEADAETVPVGFNLYGWSNNRELFDFLNIYHIGEQAVFESPTGGNANFVFSQVDINALLFLRGISKYPQFSGNEGDSEIATVGYVKSLTVHPIIITQPQDVTAQVNDPVSFAVVAARATGYQWYWRSGPSGTWAASTTTSGKSATYTTTATTARNGQQYYCEVKNSYGSTYSDIVTLTVV